MIYLWLSLSWYFFGLLLLVVTLSHEDDLKVHDLWMVFCMSFLGPLLLVAVLAAFLDEHKEKVLIRRWGKP